MSSICYTQILANVMQITRLDDCGLPVTGSGNRAIFESFIDVVVNPNRQGGSALNLRDGSGIVQIVGANPAQNTSNDVSITLCLLDPETIALLDAATDAVTVTGAPSVTGGTFIPVTGTPAVGNAFSYAPNKGPVAIELWAKIAGVCGGEQCWSRWFLARLINLHRERLIWENDGFTLSLSGTLLGNPKWGNGVNGEHPRAVGSNEPLVYERNCNAPPIAICGTVAVTGAPGMFAGLGDVRVSGAFATQMRTLQKASATRLVHSLAIGDSLIQGAFATNWRTHSFLGLVNAALQAQLGDGGAGIQSVANSPVGAGAYIPQTGLWFPADGSATGTVMAGVAGATMTFDQTRGRRLRIHYQSFILAPTGRLGYTIDGGAQQVIQTFAPWRDRVTMIDTGSSGAHTIVITALDTVALGGVEMDNDTGWVFHNTARGGRNSADPLKRSLDDVDNTVYQDSTLTVTLRQTPVDLLYYSLIANDALDGVSVATNYDNIIRTFDQAKAVNPDMAIMAIAPHAGNIVPGTVSAATFQQYVDNLERAANQMGGAFIDLWAEGDNSLAFMQARGYMNPDNIHWTDAGHAWAAEIVMRAFKSGLG